MPRRLALASGNCTNSASSERSARSPRASSSTSVTSPADTPMLFCSVARPASKAKLDHKPSTRPRASASTPSKSLGPLTSWMVSRLASRNRRVRDKGRFRASMDDTLVDWDASR